MDKLKYVKLENPDGSYSNPIALSVDAQNVNVGSSDLDAYIAQNNSNIASLQQMDIKLDDRISNNASAIQSLASGSPAGVYATVTALTAADPDHSKIYVVTADGHWYYYNGSIWTDGGVYQAFQISEEGIKINKLNPMLKNFYNLNDKTLLVNPSWEEGYFYKTNGTQVTKKTYVNTACDEISVTEGEVYNIYGYSSGEAGSFVVADSGDNSLLSPTVTSGYGFQTIIIPTNATKLYINKWLNKKEVVISKVTSLNISEENSQEIQNSFIDLVKEYDGLELKDFSQTISNTKYTRWIYITTQGNVSNNDIIELQAYVYADDINKITGIEISDNIDGSSPYNRRSLYLTSYNYENKKVFKKINDNLYKINLRITTSEYSGSARSLLIGLTIEQSTSNYICYMYNIQLKNITQNTNLEIYNNITSYSNNEKKIKYNYLNNEIRIENYIPNYGFSKWYAIGDSITEKNRHAAKNYIDYVVEDLKYIEAINLGVSGTGYNAGKDSNHAYINRLEQISNYNIETDIITVYGSTNDYGRPLGQKGDTTDDTVYGSLYLFFEALNTRFIGYRIGLITPLPIQNNYHSTTEINYRHALIEMAEEYNVPILDITRSTNLHPNLESFRNVYYLHDGVGGEGTIDGTHPNSLGHRIIANQIKEFIKKL